MAIKWKSSKRFKPELVLKRIEAVRSIDENGRISYVGFELDECLPTLHSMLFFPAVAADVEKETLVWRALGRVEGDLTPASFLSALNLVLDEKLSVRDVDYFMLTSLSLDPAGLPKKIKILDSEIQFLPNGFPNKFSSWKDLIRENRVSIPETPSNYCKISVKVRAKSDGSAFHKAMKAVDLLRAVLCSMGNSRMQITHGASTFDPINVIRLGGRHTIHLSSGQGSRNGIWYEPSFAPERLHRFDKPEFATKNLRFAIRKMAKSNLQNVILASLLKFVRGFDQSDHNIAFLRLWSALEALTTPNSADYDMLIRRSAFLYRDNAYHLQVLEHLRSYRNANVHAGEESENARIYCFQLQMYFVDLIWFYIGNADKFSSVDDVGEFLDLPPDPIKLRSRRLLIGRAIKFVSPK